MGVVLLASTVFMAGYAIIAQEDRLNLNKALTGAALAGTLWLIIALTGDHATLHSSLEILGADVFGLIIFLLSAMLLVEVLDHYRFFDLVRAQIAALKLNDYHQCWTIAVISFFLSAIIDNLTTTIVMLELSRRFFSGKNLTYAAATIIIAANAGGAWSPIGDITTIMLWLAGKYTASQIITWGFLPSLSLLFVSVSLIAKNVRTSTADTNEVINSPSRSEYAVIITALSSFALPLAFKQLGLPPYFGLLFGMGIVGIVIALFSRRTRARQSHLTADIHTMLKKVDFASIIFFAGILLAVGALKHLGILATISQLLFGEAPTFTRLVTANAALGMLSALIDNIPLTAAAIDILNTTDPRLWVLLALTVGTGGSMIIIGSAAGVVAMNRVKGLDFFSYLRIAGFPAAAGYVVCIAVWVIQYLLFG